MSYPKRKGDVEWYSHKGRRKRPLSYSTKATSDFLVIVHQQNPFFTIKQLKELLGDRTKWIYNPDADMILNAYIKAGEGDIVPQWR